VTDIRKEIAIMSISKHKNIVPEYVSFLDQQYLWIVMKIVDAGSCADIMRLTLARNQGIQDEVIIATILK
jgi:serine/threonine protein kinase